MEPEFVFEKSAIGPYPEPAESNPTNLIPSEFPSLLFLTKFEI
jgi:hypothetical protein